MNDKEFNKIIIDDLDTAYKYIEKSGEEIDGTNVCKKELYSIKRGIKLLKKLNKK